VARRVTKLTKFVNAQTVVSADTANSWYGGLHGSVEGESLDADDPRLVGHVHDGQHLDGHSSKVNLEDHVTGELQNSNLADDAVTKRNIASFTSRSSAIPTSETIGDDTFYYVDVQSSDVSFGDDEYLTFGDDLDFQVGYASGTRRVRLFTEDVTDIRSVVKTASIWTSTGYRKTTDSGAGPDSGDLKFFTGYTDTTHASGTAGNSGFIILETGAANSTAGTSGDSGVINLITGSSADANSGDILFETGTAEEDSGNIYLTTGASTSGTRGSLIINAETITVPDDTEIYVGTDNDSFISFASATATMRIRTTDAVSANSSSLRFQTGDTTTSGNSGNMLFEVGTAAGTKGYIKFDANYAWIQDDQRFYFGTDLDSSIRYSTTGNRLRIETSGVTSADSSDIYVISGSTTTSGTTGDLRFNSGNSAAASGNAELYTGTGTTTGYVVVNSGSASAGASGYVLINSGPTSSGTSGVLSLYSGNGTTGTGTVTIQSGNATSGASGAFSMFSGTGTTSTGLVEIKSGNASAGDSGNISLESGTATGTRGYIKFNANYAWIQDSQKFYFGTDKDAYAEYTGSAFKIHSTGTAHTPQVWVGSGAPASTYDSGESYYKSGNATGVGGQSGNVYLGSGDSDANTSGHVEIFSGVSGTTSGNTYIKTGNATGTAGNILLYTGTGASLQGYIQADAYYMNLVDDMPLSFGTDSDSYIHYISANNRMRIETKDVVGGNSASIYMITGATTTTGDSGEILIKSSNAVENSGDITL
jgi:hypothetical protein